MRTRRYSLLKPWFILLMVTLLVLPAAACTEAPKYQGKIAFVSFLDNKPQIYAMNPDGSEKIILTDTSIEGSRPVWSPDGTRIAFMSGMGGNYDLYLMNADGTNQVRLTTNPAEDWFPTWSPDGKQIAFISKRDGDFDIYRMNSDGSNQRNLTMNPSTDNTPAWSPDGKWIVFWSSRDGGGLFLMDTEGSNIKRLTADDSDFYPAWSPDGKKIAFDSSRWGFQAQVYTMNIDGTDIMRVSQNIWWAESPYWSPEGILLAGMDAYLETDIYLIKDNNITNLTNTPEVSEYWPSFGLVKIN
jgi:Tol biopolymer transport system component